ncbi:MAG: hypothetical protein RR619_00600, partial [Raoultibacter sp.]
PSVSARALWGELPKQSSTASMSAPTLLAIDVPLCATVVLLRSNIIAVIPFSLIVMKTAIKRLRT